jgi:hypothetical protein
VQLVVTGKELNEQKYAALQKMSTDSNSILSKALNDRRLSEKFRSSPHLSPVSEEDNDQPTPNTQQDATDGQQEEDQITSLDDLLIQQENSRLEECLTPKEILQNFLNNDHDDYLVAVNGSLQPFDRENHSRLLENTSYDNLGDSLLRNRRNFLDSNVLREIPTHATNTRMMSTPSSPLSSTPRPDSFAFSNSNLEDSSLFAHSVD